jgi:predicted ATP-grasp superfamily ATP-dependent carboligase
MNNNAIIIDGQLKSALAAVRSLGKAGVYVSVGAERKSAPALHSRFTKTRFVYPSPYTEKDAFIRAVKAEAVRLGGKPVIYAFSDVTFLLLHEHRSELREYATLVFSNEKSIGIAFDKAATYSLARVSSIPTISTFTPATEDEFTRLRGTFQYPVVIKPRQSVTWRGGVGVFGSAKFAMDADDLKTKYDAMREKFGQPPLIQERVVGEEYGVEMIAEKGEPRALVVHHRLRSLSPTGGASVLKEIESGGALHEILVTYAKKLVHELLWEGPIMVEFKVDSDTRTPKLMEVNGRFWGSLPLAVHAGVDMPYLYYLLATGGELPKEVVTPREGVTTRHLMGDMLHLIRVLFARDPMRSLVYPKRLQAVKDFFKTPKGTRGDVWSFSDPKPAFMELIDILKTKF